MISRRTLAGAIWALGASQILGYGTLYYSFSILAPAIATEFGLSQEWVFGALSATLLASSLLAPVAGRMADRFGAGRIMTAGSLAAAVALTLCALAPDRASFVLALLVMELAACFVFYSTAFAAIVQIGAPHPQKSITHLTLIAGFASTLFWPLTSSLHEFLTWRQVYFIFAALHLAFCLPIHAWLARLSSTQQKRIAARVGGTTAAEQHAELDPRQRQTAFLLMLAGFALEGFVLSAILIHMVPLTATLGLGSAGLLVATLFGPAQVASRLVNMLFGGRLKQTHLAVTAASLLLAGLAVLLATTPWLPGAIVFALLFGLGSGLTSIVGGTLPLELFGRRGYGAHLGWIGGARQFTSAVAPFAFAWMMVQVSVTGALWLLAATGSAGVLAFTAIAVVQRQADRLRVSAPADLAAEQRGLFPSPLVGEGGSARLRAETDEGCWKK